MVGIIGQQNKLSPESILTELVSSVGRYHVTLRQWVNATKLSTIYLTVLLKPLLRLIRLSYKYPFIYSNSWLWMTSNIGKKSTELELELQIWNWNWKPWNWNCKFQFCRNWNWNCRIGIDPNPDFSRTTVWVVLNDIGRRGMWHPTNLQDDPEILLSIKIVFWWTWCAGIASGLPGS